MLYATVATIAHHPFLARSRPPAVIHRAKNGCGATQAVTSAIRRPYGFLAR